jgi:hypothetical protein
MRLLILGIIAGLALGTPSTVKAHRSPEPCAHSWILWGHDNSRAGWQDPVKAYATQEECERDTKLEHLSDAGKAAAEKLGLAFACFPETFNPKK